jgi:tellurite methyltransferase
MQRKMTGFHLDEQGDWVAELDCGHGQHVRHKPPFQMRPWVTTIEGRVEKLGQSLQCVRCDALELPEGFLPYKKTAEFNNESIPAGLLRDHSLKSGTWGRLTLLEGCLRFTMNSVPPQAARSLTTSEPTHIPPEVVHAIEPLGRVRFFIEFCKNPRTT